MIPNLPLTNYLSVIFWFSASWRFGCAWGWLGACVLLVASQVRSGTGLVQRWRRARRELAGSQARISIALA